MSSKRSSNTSNNNLGAATVKSNIFLPDSALPGLLLLVIVVVTHVKPHPPHPASFSALLAWLTRSSKAVVISIISKKQVFAFVSGFVSSAIIAIIICVIIIPSNRNVEGYYNFV